MSALIDLTGRTFGRLTVLNRAEGTNTNKCAFWRCICDCGNSTIVNGDKLRRARTQSCGCLQLEYQKFGSIVHGMAGTSEYSSWQHMKARCYRTTHVRFADWGGRGITVCDRWREGFTNFLTDMGMKPSSSHSLDRIDNDGNYEPGNCRWATPAEQNANKRAYKS